MDKTNTHSVVIPMQSMPYNYNSKRIRMYTYCASRMYLYMHVSRYLLSSLLQMVSVERVVAYSKLEPEAPLETPPGRERPPEAWPQSGTICVQNMNFRYAEDAPCILKDISIDIKPGEKVHSTRLPTFKSLAFNQSHKANTFILATAMLWCDIS